MSLREVFLYVGSPYRGTGQALGGAGSWLVLDAGGSWVVGCQDGSH